MGYMHPERQNMTFDETVLLLKSRRTLTGQVYDDVAFNAWHTALEPWSYTEVLTAMIDAARTESKIAVAHIVKHLPPRKPDIYVGPDVDDYDEEAGAAAHATFRALAARAETRADLANACFAAAAAYRNTIEQRLL